MNDKNYLKQYGGTLIDNGFHIVPIAEGTKYPKGVKNWQSIDATKEDVRQWVGAGFPGVGVLTRDNPAVDIDVYDEELVEDVISYVVRHCGETLRRVGNAPKTLLVYRTDEPFEKVSSRVFIDPDGNENKVEILGDGQQFVAFATHPDTGKPYVWTDEAKLNDTGSDLLSTITIKQAKGVVKYFEKCADILGWKPKGFVNGETDNFTESIPASMSRSLDLYKEKSNLSPKQIYAFVKQMDADDYDTWYRVGMALYFQYDGGETGFRIWDKWSSTSGKYEDGETAAKWKTFKASGDRAAITIGAVYEMAKAQGIDVQAAIDAVKSKPKLREADLADGERKAFPFIDPGELMTALGPIDWVVEGYIENQSVGMLFGDPGSYKSFLAIDIGLHCAAGRLWHDKAVKQGPVVFVAGEGFGGLSRRVAAWGEHYGVDFASESVPFYVSRQAASLYDMDSALDVCAAIEALVTGLGGVNPVLIVIDTLARNFGAGDENSTADMNRFIDHVDVYLKARFGCSVLLVHHTGHANKERARGAMALKGALDFEYRVERSQELATATTVGVINTKMKDAEQPGALWLEAIAVEIDAENDIDSLVLIETDAPVVEERKPLGGKQAAVYDELVAWCRDGSGAEKKAFYDYLKSMGVADDPRDVMYRLIKKKWITETDGFLWPADADLAGFLAD